MVSHDFRYKRVISRGATFFSNISEQIKEILSLAERASVLPTVACQCVRAHIHSLPPEWLFSLCDITYMKTFEGVFNSRPERALRIRHKCY
jgi:hypothetical protein